VKIIPDGLEALVMLAVVDGRPQELRPEGTLKDAVRFVGVRLKMFIIKSLSVVSLILLTLIPKET
jgi:hypothetical protein